MKQSKGDPKGKDAGTAKGPTAVSATSASKKFGGYRPEEEKPVRIPDVKEDRVLKELRDAWKDLECGNLHPDEACNNIISAVRHIQYSSEDIGRFSILMAEFQEEEYFSRKAGFFLSALINNGNEDDYTVHTKHLAVPIDSLGYRNRKSITVKGGVGNDVGLQMQKGTITVEGDARDGAGDKMRGGTITIEGDVRTAVGYWMVKGTVIVKGNAGGGAGSGMTGGTVTINGNAGSNVGIEMEGGKVIVEGDAGRDAGFAMQRGIIIIKGNTGKGVGNSMEGGRIYIEGELGGLSPDVYVEGELAATPNIKGGIIFHKGKPVGYRLTPR